MTKRAIVVLFASAAPLLATGHPLEDATRIAAELCQRVNALSIDQCGTTMDGRTLAHSAARMAVKRLFDLRSAFVKECEGDAQPQRCIDQGDLLILEGMWEAQQHPLIRLPD